MKRILIFFIILFQIVFLAFCAGNTNRKYMSSDGSQNTTNAEGDGSQISEQAILTGGKIMQSKPLADQILSDFKNTLMKMQEMTEQVDELVSKGKTYENSNSYGVFDGDYALYFNPQENNFGLIRYKEQKQETLLSVTLKDNGKNVSYYLKKTDGYEFFYNNNAGIEYFYFTFQDKSKLSVYEDKNNEYYPLSYIQYSYPNDEDLFYELFKQGGTDFVILSEKLNEQLFFDNSLNKTEKNKYINDIVSDASYYKFSKILSEANNQGVDLTNIDELYLFATNYIRNELSVSEVKLSETLKQAGDNHLKYVEANWEKFSFDLSDLSQDSQEAATGIHYEKEGRPFFTGVNPADRTKRLNYELWTFECGGFATLGNPISDVLQMYDVIYHRRLYPNRNTKEISYSYRVNTNNEDKTHSLLMYGFTYDENDDVVVCPYDGEIDVPTAWNGIEAPVPLPGYEEPFGYPITVYYGNKKNKDIRVSLFDSENNPVEMYYINEIRSDIAWEDLYQEYVVKKPLKYDTEYRLVIKGEYVDKEVKFRTKKKDAPFLLKEELQANIEDSFSEYNIRNGKNYLKNGIGKKTEISFENEVQDKGDHKTITNKNYGISIQLKSDWTVVESVNQSNPFSIQGDEFYAYIGTNYVHPSNSLESLIENDEKYRQDEAQFGEKQSIKEITIKGISGKQANYFLEGKWNKYTDIIYLLEDNLYILLNLSYNNKKDLEYFLKGFQMN